MNKKQENILREFLRRELVRPMVEQQRKEEKVRLFIRSIIKEHKNDQMLYTLYEAKDTANPHPNTGINKLRDALRKAKPSIKTKYQQLTTSPEQRESFKNHFLGAMVRLFDELDALNAQGKEAEDVASEFDDAEAGEDGTEAGGNELEAPPEDKTSDDLADELGSVDDAIEALQEALLNEFREADIDVVSDEFDEKESNEKEKSKSQAEKDFEKKKESEAEKEEFGSGIEGDSTGRNQSFDAFNLVQSYFSDAYLDLGDEEDMEMFKKWGLYNTKLLLQKYEEELDNDPEAPNIEEPT
jgi:hypothetical protein